MLQNSSTYKFFILYNMLYERKQDISLMRLGCRPIFFVLEYIKYDHIYMNMIDTYDYGKYYEERIEVNCDTLTSIKVEYVNDPINCLATLFDRSKITRNKRYDNNNFTLCSRIAENGHLECLKYAHTNHNCPWTSWACMFAADYGHLACLEYATKNGCPCEVWVSYKAACHLECLKYLHRNRLPINHMTCEFAVMGRKLECLKYLHSRKCVKCGECECDCGDELIDGYPYDKQRCLNLARGFAEITEYIEQYM